MPALTLELHVKKQGVKKQERNMNLERGSLLDLEPDRVLWAISKYC